MTKEYSEGINFNSRIAFAISVINQSVVSYKIFLNDAILSVPHQYKRRKQERVNLFLAKSASVCRYMRT